jgi:hypothetical protein
MPVKIIHGFELIEVNEEHDACLILFQSRFPGTKLLEKPAAVWQASQFVFSGQMPRALL